MKGKLSLWSGVVLLGLGLAIAGCGERGEWMKEKALNTDGSTGTATTEAGEQGHQETREQLEDT